MVASRGLIGLGCRLTAIEFSSFNKFSLSNSSFGEILCFFLGHIFNQYWNVVVVVVVVAAAAAVVACILILFPFLICYCAFESSSFCFHSFVIIIILVSASVIVRRNVAVLCWWYCCWWWYGEDPDAVTVGVMPAICSKGRQVFSGIHHLQCNESGQQVIWMGQVTKIR